MAAAALCQELSTAILGLLGTLGDKGEVRGLLLLVLLNTATLQGDTMTLPLELVGGDEALDLRGLAVLLAILCGHCPANDELAHIVLFVEVEELADLRGTLRSEADWFLGVGQARNLL